MFKSSVALTYELDDIPVAVSELVNKTQENITLRKNSMGILLSDSGADNKTLLEGLRNQLDFPLIGCSTAGIMSGRNDVGSLTGALVTLTSDEASFSTAYSEPLTGENLVSQIESTYKRALESLKGKPCMILVFVPIPTKEIVLDNYPNVLSEISGGLPVFGGVNSVQSNEEESIIFTGEGLSHDRMVLALISDEAKPVFSMNSRLYALGNLKRTVTHAEGNVIYKVGDETFVEFIKHFGLEIRGMPEGEVGRAEILSSVPVVIEANNFVEGYGNLPIVRCVVGIDLETGAGIMGGGVPQGSIISVVVSSKNDLEITARESAPCIASRMKKNEDEGYEYSLILICSCVTRFLSAFDKNMEVDTFIKNLPMDIPLIGLYCHGEICPVYEGDDKLLNFAHNYSFAVLAI